MDGCEGAGLVGGEPVLAAQDDHGASCRGQSGQLGGSRDVWVRPGQEASEVAGLVEQRPFFVAHRAAPFRHDPRVSGRGCRDGAIRRAFPAPVRLWPTAVANLANVHAARVAATNPSAPWWGPQCLPRRPCEVGRDYQVSRYDQGTRSGGARQIRHPCPLPLPGARMRD